MNLKNLCVLVTRPKPDGEVLCEKIRALQGDAFFFPTIDIIPPKDVEYFHHQVAELNKYNWIIFISPQAVRQSMSVIRHYWKILPDHLKVASVGSGTAKILEDMGLPQGIFPEESWSAEGLLALPEFQDVSHQKIAIICGEGGRTEWLAKVLTEKKGEVALLIAYQRVLPKIDTLPYLEQLKQKRINVTLVTSIQSIKNLMILTGKENAVLLYNMPLIVISQRILAYARELGFKKIYLAKNSSHDSVIRALFNVKEDTWSQSSNH